MTLPISNSLPSTPSGTDVAQLAVLAAVMEQWEKLLGQPSPENLAAIVKHWHVWPLERRVELKHRKLDFAPAIRAALVESDLQVKHNAFDAATELQVTGLLPDLIKLSMQPSYVHRATSSSVLLQLTEILYRENQKTAHVSVDGSPSSDGQSQGEGPPPKAVFRYPPSVSKLRQLIETSLQHYKLGGRSEVLIVFLSFADHDDVWVERILSDKMHPAHNDLLGLFESSENEAVVEKLAGFLGFIKPLPCITSIWRRRRDIKFLQRFLHVIAREPKPEVIGNLRRLSQPFWLNELVGDIRGLTLVEQQALLILIQNCLPQDEDVLEALAKLLPQANIVLRRKIVALICQISGMRANGLVADLIERETDGETLVLLIPELRRRNLARAMKRLLGLLDHSHEGVRRKAAEAFHDCSIQRYLSAYDLLDEPVRRSTGQLVYKVDPATNRVLSDELSCGNRVRQVRALQAIRSIGNIDEMCGLVLKIAQLPDPRLKITAIGALAGSSLPEAKSLIRRYLVDDNPSIRKAAELSLDVAPDIFENI
ncbi:MAG: HEAT repeat domain-containing protein [Planctomycetaceae bacterium]|nr:HEAT repeat domain-containing protein [Planctomycetaceae bacterium]